MTEIRHVRPPYSGVDDQFLLGGDVLLAPVLEYGARERKLCLPSGLRGRTPGPVSRRLAAAGRSTPAPLGQVPVYLREGGSVPPWGLSSAKERAVEKRDKPLDRKER